VKGGRIEGSSDHDNSIILWQEWVRKPRRLDAILCPGFIKTEKGDDEERRENQQTSTHEGISSFYSMALGSYLYIDVGLK
jgi:hypothetical protein